MIELGVLVVLTALPPVFFCARTTFMRFVLDADASHRSVGGRTSSFLRTCVSHPLHSWRCPLHHACQSAGMSTSVKTSPLLGFRAKEVRDGLRIANATCKVCPFLGCGGLACVFSYTVPGMVLIVTVALFGVKME